MIIFGDQDTDADPIRAPQRWKEGLDKAGNKNYEIKIFKNANHGIRIGEHDYNSPIFWQPFAEGYVEWVMKWIEKS